MANSTLEIETTSDVLPSVTGEEHIVETHASTEAHAGPHIPLIQGEQVWGPISNVTLTTLMFLGIVLGIAITAKKNLANNSDSKIKLFFLNFTKFFDDQLTDAFQDKETGRKYYGLVVGTFFIIFF